MNRRQLWTLNFEPLTLPAGPATFPGPAEKFPASSVRRSPPPAGGREKRGATARPETAARLDGSRHRTMRRPAPIAAAAIARRESAKPQRTSCLPPGLTNFASSSEKVAGEAEGVKRGCEGLIILAIDRI